MCTLESNLALGETVLGVTSSSFLIPSSLSLSLMSRLLSLSGGLSSIVFTLDVMSDMRSCMVGLLLRHSLSSRSLMLLFLKSLPKPVRLKSLKPPDRLLDVDTQSESMPTYLSRFFFAFLRSSLKRSSS